MRRFPPIIVGRKVYFPTWSDVAYLAAVVALLVYAVARALWG